MPKVFGLLLVICGAWFLWHARASKAKAKEAILWSKAKGQILSSKVVRAVGFKPTVYRVQISYQYRVAGQVYSNNRLTLGGEVNSGRSKAQKRCDNYPPGSDQDVFFNTSNPEESYLVTKTEGLVLEVAGGLFGIAIGGLLLFGILPPQ